MHRLTDKDRQTGKWTDRLAKDKQTVRWTDRLTKIDRQVDGRTD
jgi:hypothetical protein